MKVQKETFEQRLERAKARINLKWLRRKETFEQRLERRMKNWKQEQHEKKVFGDSSKATVYDGWFWNGHLNKFERWEQHLESMKTKAFKEWYTRGG